MYRGCRIDVNAYARVCRDVTVKLLSMLVFTVRPSARDIPSDFFSLSFFFFFNTRTRFLSACINRISALLRHVQRLSRSRTALSISHPLAARSLIEGRGLRSALSARQQHFPRAIRPFRRERTETGFQRDAGRRVDPRDDAIREISPRTRRGLFGALQRRRLCK